MAVVGIEPQNIELRNFEFRRGEKRISNIELRNIECRSVGAPSAMVFYSGLAIGVGACMPLQGKTVGLERSGALILVW
jgi:hypothetical protein